MRIHIKTTANKELVPFNYQPMLTGALHRWIGEKNELHDDVSLYSFSWLNGGKAVKGGLNFEDGARYFISSTDNELLKNLVFSIEKHPELDFGLSVNEVTIEPDPTFNSGEDTFYYASPILVKRKVNDNEIHFDYKSSETSQFLTETLKHKLKKAGLPHEGIRVMFDTGYFKAKTKVVHYKKIGNKVNLCPVKITGTPEQKAFAWNAGIGNSTGIGFGAIRL
ncbi:MAG: CRISPR-associated endoribonuclease Cas6 [Cryomorphaceae bacterium]|nr:CRISPR-associated endoribonuclease Cas6 [Cryomorphaceae bacterium]